MVKTRCLYLSWAWLGTGRDTRTDRRTDRIPIANTRSQHYVPVQLSRVKTGFKLAEMGLLLGKFSQNFEIEPAYTTFEDILF